MPTTSETKIITIGLALKNLNLIVYFDYNKPYSDSLIEYAVTNLYIMLAQKLFKVKINCQNLTNF